MENYSPIPQPKIFGPLGNLPLINKDLPTQSLCKIADELGPIFRFQALGFSFIVVSGHELVAELCDESRFDKSVAIALYKLRTVAKDALFTGLTKEPNWQKAHNILLPAFSQQAMKGYHDMMVDIAKQLVEKWGRLNTNESIDIPDNMTRLTLDTIGLCGFNYRFNSFYRENHNPFIISMIRSLNEAMLQSTRLPIQQKFMFRTNRQYAKDIDTMFSLVDQLISERKENGDQGETDLLARMLNAKDPVTGEQLDDENIRYQIITFLIAGHETTSGLLSFALYLLVKHPEVLLKAYEEVDRVTTSSIPTYQEVLNLKYIRMILNEALRLYPTAPQFALYAKDDTVIGGKYQIKKHETVAVLLPQLHREKEAWGEDAEEFRPERFEDPSKIPAHAYKPFGNGQRACIGMQFALHEAALVLGMILRNFELIDHTNYQLKIKQSLTLKPDGFTLQVKARDKKAGLKRVSETVFVTQQVKPVTVDGINNRPLLVLYGSNMGTAERIAHELTETARSYGVRSEAMELNESAGKLPTEGAVLIVTSSYNGKPSRNARKFVQWLEKVDPGSLNGVNYAIFGCGDRNWASTYQNVPRLIDEQLAAKGATRFSERGEGDVSGDFETQLQDWKKQMWSDAVQAFGLTIIEKENKPMEILKIQFVSDRFSPFSPTEYECVSELIQQSSKQNGISLPDGVSWKDGDYLGVFSANSMDDVNRILRRYELNGSDRVILSTKNTRLQHLPLGREISLFHLLSHYIELEGPASSEQIRELASFTVCPPHKRELEALLTDGVYHEMVVSRGVTMLDLLEKYQACEMPFERFLELLPPKKPKYYFNAKFQERMMESR